MKLTNLIPTVICFLLMDIAYPMNDTDGVCGKGLFPIGSNAKAIVLLNEHVDITLTKRGTVVRRTYEIQNQGSDDTFTFGAINCYNCVSESKGDYLAIKVNGKPVKCRNYLSFLRDSGTVVTQRNIKFKDAREAIASLDGTIETHAWVSFRKHIRANSIARVEVEQREHPVESNFTQALVGILYLYTEKFWAADTIPLVEVRFGTENNFVPIEYFTPSGENWDKTSIKPDTVANNQLVWIFRNYTPKKTMYSYTLKLLHPYAVKQELIAETFSKATGIKVK